MSKKYSKYLKKWRIDNAEYIKESGRYYYQKNKEKIKEKNKKDKEKITERGKKYYQANKVKINERAKQYRENNKEKTKERIMRWKKNNPDKIKEYNRKNRDRDLKQKKEYIEKRKLENPDYRKQYYETHKKEIKKHNDKWKNNNKEKMLLNSRIYRENNRERMAINHKRHYDKNKKKIFERMKMRKRTDPDYAFKCNMVSRVVRFFYTTGSIKNKRTEVIIGASWRTAIDYLNSLGYNRKIHDIDHIVPLSAFDIQNELHQKIMFNYLNLSPELKGYNRSIKNNKLLPNWKQTINIITSELNIDPEPIIEYIEAQNIKILYEGQSA